MDPVSLYVQNLLEAFRQLNQFLGLALATSVSALALERRAAASSEKPIEYPGMVPLSREDAQLVLIGIAFLAGLMGSYAAESAAGIVSQLVGAPNVLKAACTYPSVATAPVGIPVIAAALPVIFAAPVFWRKWRHVKERGILGLLGLFAIPFAVLAGMLGTMPCRAS
jgi:hypothetical protein